MRMIPIKNEREIQCMRRSCALARDVLERAALLCVPGITTLELDRAVAEMIREAGAKSAFLGYRGFPGTCCISLNEEVVHGIGKQRRVQYGDIVKLDVGVILDGWVGDTAMTVAVGGVSPDVEKLMAVTQEALRIALSHVQPGGRVGDVSAAIEEFSCKNGYTVVREFVGHGVGRKLHEEPQIPNFGKRGSGPKFKPGMTVAIEPMVNMGTPAVLVCNDNWTVVTADGKPSAHFEHTVLVTEHGHEVLTCQTQKASK
jgi:methionyl aminopeptidase